jgi:hypothetical protein
MNGVRRLQIRRLALLHILLCGGVIVLLGIAGCENKQLTRMEQNQIRLQAMVAANARQLATVSSQVYVSDTEVQERLLNLDQNDRGLGVGMTTVQNEQARLHETVTAGNTALDKRMTTLDGNQRVLQDGITQVAGITQRTASDVTAVAREQVTLHEMVQSSRQELAGSIATIASNQQETRTDIAKLQQADRGIVEQLTVFAADQNTMRQTLDSNHRIVTGQVAALGQNQQTLGADVGKLNQKTDQAAGRIDALATGQNAIRDIVKSNGETMVAKLAGLDQNQAKLNADLAGLSTKADTIASGVGTISTGQTALRDLISTNHETAATSLAALSEKQTSLIASTDSIGAKADALAAGQNAIQGTIRNNGETVATKLTALDENQAKLDADLTGLSGKADTIASGVGTISTGQTALRDLISTNHQTTASALAALSEKQTKLVANTEAMGAKADAMTGSIRAVVERQAALEQGMKAGNDALAARGATICDNQQAMKTALESLARDAQQAPARQQTLQDQLDTLTATLGQTALDIIGLKDSQNLLQQAMQAGLGDIHAKTAELSTSLVPLAKSQESLNQTMRDHAEAMNRQVTTLASRQTDMQSSVDSIMATTAQTALDVLGASGRQDALAQGLRSHSEAVTGQMADVVRAQQQMESGLDTLVATTGQSALDILALSDGQARLHQSAQADRTELAARLAEIVQGQQQWAQRFDAAQGSMQTIAASTASLEQQIARLQAAIQTNVEGLTAALQTGTQNRRQVETKVNQDIQAMIEALSQIRQAHALLTEQMQQMQSKTQGQTADIISAIEHLKQPAPELKVSDSIVKPAPSVAAAAAKSDQPKPPVAEVTASNPNQKLESSVAEAAAK